MTSSCAAPTLADPDRGSPRPSCAAYRRLHELGWAHSFESFDEHGTLVGGLYGVRLGSFFAGEAMFHHARDASKVALVELVDWLNVTGATLLDVQWLTPHLASLGAIAVDRDEYLRRLADWPSTR